MRPLGVVAGYRGEARCLVGADLRVLCSGADPAGARAAAQRLADEGVAGLVSFGLAGGLAADLAPGDLLLPQAVVLPDGGRIATDAAWRERLAATLERAGLRARNAPVAGSERLVATGEAKRALARADRSPGRRHGKPRRGGGRRARRPAVPDRARGRRSQRSGDPARGAGAIDAQGDIRHLALLGRLLAGRGRSAALIALGRSSGRGSRRLRRVAVLAPGLGFV